MAISYRPEEPREIIAERFFDELHHEIKEIILGLPRRFMKENLKVGYDSNDKCIIPVEKFSHFIATLPATFKYQHIRIACYSCSVDLSMLY